MVSTAANKVLKIFKPIAAGGMAPLERSHTACKGDYVKLNIPFIITCKKTNKQTNKQKKNKKTTTKTKKKNLNFPLIVLQLNKTMEPRDHCFLITCEHKPNIVAYLCRNVKSKLVSA